MGQGKSNGSDGGSSVFLLLAILVLIVGIVAAAGMVMAVLNYTRNSDTPININVGGDGPGSGTGLGGDENGNGMDEGYNDDHGYAYMPSPSVQDTHYDPRVWTIQANAGASTLHRRAEYVDPKTRQLKGYIVDVVNAVCQIAGKNCVMLSNPLSNCWNNGMPGQGLLNKWYDACALYSISLDRLRSLKFSKSLSPTPKPVFLTLLGNPSNFDAENLAGEKIGFYDAWWADKYCLLHSLNYELADEQIEVYDSENALVEALNNNEVQAIFVSNELGIAIDGSLHVAKEVTACLQGGDSLMMRKDSLLKEWWDQAFEKLVNSRTYRGICNDLEDPAVHGNIPGRPAEEICVEH